MTSHPVSPEGGEGAKVDTHAGHKSHEGLTACGLLLDGRITVRRPNCRTCKRMLAWWKRR